MTQRKFTKRPKEKKEDYHGSCQIAWLPKSYRGDAGSPAPKSLNLHLNFEEALKFNLAIQSCLHALNRYNRSNKAGKEMGVGLSLKFNVKQIAVIESQL
jgi:hypothetical protein